MTEHKRSYRLVFQRVGRKHDLSPITVMAADHAQLVDQIYTHARPHLMSHDVEIALDPGATNGHILVAGFRNGGAFTITSRPADDEAAGTRTCTRCEETKPLDQFGHLAVGRDGHTTQCRACATRRMRAWREANPERARLTERGRYLAARRLREKHQAEYAELLTAALAELDDDQ